MILLLLVPVHSLQACHVPSHIHNRREYCTFCCANDSLSCYIQRQCFWHMRTALLIVILPVMLLLTAACCCAFNCCKWGCCLSYSIFYLRTLVEWGRGLVIKAKQNDIQRLDEQIISLSQQIKHLDVQLSQEIISIRYSRQSVPLGRLLAQYRSVEELRPQLNAQKLLEGGKDMINMLGVNHQ